MKEFKNLKLAVEYVINTYPKETPGLTYASPLFLFLLENRNPEEEFVRQLNIRGIESEYKDGIIYIKEKPNTEILKVILNDSKDYLVFGQDIHLYKITNIPKPKENDWVLYEGVPCQIVDSSDWRRPVGLCIYIKNKFKHVKLTPEYKKIVASTDNLQNVKSLHISVIKNFVYNFNKNNTKQIIMKAEENYIMLEGKKILLTEEQIKQIKSSVTSKPKWENFGEVKGFYVNTRGEIVNYTSTKPSNLNKNTFPSKEEAEACLALSQLLQWRDKYNEGWKPDWYNHNTYKSVIDVCENKITSREYNQYKRTLAFKTKEIRDKFLEDFADLLEIAKPLL